MLELAEELAATGVKITVLTTNLGTIDTSLRLGMGQP